MRIRGAIVDRMKAKATSWLAGVVHKCLLQAAAQVAAVNSGGGTEPGGIRITKTETEGVLQMDRPIFEGTVLVLAESAENGGMTERQVVDALASVVATYVSTRGLSLPVFSSTAKQYHEKVETLPSA